MTRPANPGVIVRSAVSQRSRTSSKAAASSQGQSGRGGPGFGVQPTANTNIQDAKRFIALGGKIAHSWAAIIRTESRRPAIMQ